MSRLNSFVALVIVFLTGVISGMYISKYNYNQMNVEPNEMREQVEVSSKLKVGMQESFLRFYVEDYCDNTARDIIFKGFNITIKAIHCDKPAIMLLMNDLPVTVVHNLEK